MSFLLFCGFDETWLRCCPQKVARLGWKQLEVGFDRFKIGFLAQQPCQMYQSAGCLKRVAGGFKQVLPKLLEVGDATDNPDVPKRALHFLRFLALLFCPLSIGSFGSVHFSRAGRNARFGLTRAFVRQE